MYVVSAGVDKPGESVPIEDGGGESAALIRLIRPFGDLLTAIQVSPNGRLLAVADSSGLVRFINLTTWTRAAGDVKLGDPVAPRAMSFWPDGRTLLLVVVGTDRSTTSRRSTSAPGVPASFKPGMARFPAPPLGSDGVAYSPDGRSIAVSLIREANPTETPSAARVLMVDAETGRIRSQRSYPVQSKLQEEPHVAFTPSGVLLTSRSTATPSCGIPRPVGIILGCPIGGLPAISADGRQVALGRNTPFIDPVSSASMSVLEPAPRPVPDAGRQSVNRVDPGGLVRGW